MGSNLAFASKMSTQNGGRGGIIVNVASILGLFNAKQPKGNVAFLGTPFGNPSAVYISLGWAYNTSKSAVVTYTRCVADNKVCFP